jgi:hypothetical protein
MTTDYHAKYYSEDDLNKLCFQNATGSGKTLLMHVSLLQIGSKKFIEGWDCWRVSAMGLMHVGRAEGTQIIQFFGRGVRLKGYVWSLKRSGHANPPYRPAFIDDRDHYLTRLFSQLQVGLV